MKKILFLLLFPFFVHSQSIMSTKEMEDNTIIVSSQSAYVKGTNTVNGAVKLKKIRIDSLLALSAKGVSALIVNKAELSYVNLQLANKATVSQVNMLVDPKMDSVRTKMLLDLKANIVSPIFTGGVTVNGITKSDFFKLTNASQAAIYDNGNDNTYLNARLIQNLSALNQDGLFIGHGNAGSAMNRIYDGGTSNYVGIGLSTFSTSGINKFLFGNQTDDGTFAQFSGNVIAKSNLFVTGNTSLGTSNQYGLVTVQKDQNANTQIFLTNRGSGSAVRAGYYVDNGAYGLSMEVLGQTYTPSGSANGNRARIFTDATEGLAIVSQNNRISFWTGSSETEKMGIFQNGNVGIGTITPQGIIDVVSTTQPSYPFPRMTTTQVDALTGMTAGAWVFDTTTGRPKFYSGSAWVQL